jgi:hypothetical protein
MLNRKQARLTDDYIYWVGSQIHTKPVAEDLAILKAAGLIEYIEGRSKNSFFGPPFCVKLKDTEYIKITDFLVPATVWINGEPKVMSGRFICKPRELHAFVDAIIDQKPSRRTIETKG